MTLNKQSRTTLQGWSQRNNPQPKVLTTVPRAAWHQGVVLITQSILLYGSDIWADALKKEKFRMKIRGVQHRGALRVTFSYCTVSEPAALVIA